MSLFFRQYYLGCLSHASYLVGDTETATAAVVDPQRDVSQYLADAAANGLRIEYVIETHFHADFLSGHLGLVEETGAVVVYGRDAEGRTEFPIVAMADGQRIALGHPGEGVELEILETPGHTPESICVVVRESPAEVPYGVLTGDTLFIGDVGRPDLLSAVGHSAEGLARALYASLHEKLMTLPDETLVLPGHGPPTTIGRERRTNPFVGDGAVA